MKNVGERTIRLANVWLAIPVAILFGLACMPGSNPFRMHGMDELQRQKNELREALPDGLSLEETRTVLHSRRIEFLEAEENFSGIREPHAEKTAQTPEAKNRVLTAQLPTKAWEFPCGYDLRVLLVFDQEQKLRRKYMTMLPLCP